MKTQINDIEDSILVKKDNILSDSSVLENSAQKIKMSKFVLKKIKQVVFYFTTVSFISLFFLSNHVSFEKQLDFVHTKEFSGSIAVLFGLLTALYILNSVFMTAKKGEILDKQFSSVFVPIKYAIISSFFIPYNGTTSFVSQSIIDVIHLLSKFF